MSRIRLTSAQAVVKYLVAQKTQMDRGIQPLFGGIFAIFGHGNVAGMGEALYQQQKEFPTFRGHNEQSMAHAAIAFAKQYDRQRMMACTTSIGPGAANMVTAAAVAHVNRLPVLFLPGDVFASRIPEPVLQQVESYSDATVSTNDCFRPVSRYFDRITRPEQILASLPMAIATLTSPENCGPVTLALCQDVQAEAYDYPEYFFKEQIHRLRRQHADDHELAQALALLKRAKKPLLIAGGGVHYSKACNALQQFAQAHGIPVAETQAGKGALAWDHPEYVGAIGVNGSDIANQLAQQADLILAVGTRLQDFTTGSRSLFDTGKIPLIQLNVADFDAVKHNAFPLICDARLGLEDLNKGLESWTSEPAWQQIFREGIAHWNRYYDEVTVLQNGDTPSGLPTEAQVLGAIKRSGDSTDVVVCAAGGLPGELHKLWRTELPKSYHLEYGYSCMGYEIAAGMGVKIAHPTREVIVVVGDGSYMMMNSELATSVMLGHKIIVVVLDNRGFGCINRLQEAVGNAPFNNLLENCQSIGEDAPKLDFAAHAASMGAASERVESLSELEVALAHARASKKSYLISLDTDPTVTTKGGCWWDVPVAEVSVRKQVNQKREEYLDARKKQPY